ncbi:unnamed protein product [Kuraishia capsulata CBS 1993]|uniref:Uncharacterized protein n=1 Tax=Kuraishia capsulata CBS 1993 TaxID=1382522 RepID=W6MN11_9ASCO|nr:uncharacterized protein KUCA_T00003597001 [Kuraishia capsulata CBS 1993]CDK27618.1 unnamed protein product [Kuraishia capsulata CBS 1993]
MSCSNPNAYLLVVALPKKKRGFVYKEPTPVYKPLFQFDLIIFPTDLRAKKSVGKAQLSF